VSRPAFRVFSSDKRGHQLREQGYRDGRAGRPQLRHDSEYLRGWRRGLEQRQRDKGGE
jgi:hypothetical protein